MFNKAEWFSLTDALEFYKPCEVATAIENGGNWQSIGLVGR
jgi:hypothetical protein